MKVLRITYVKIVDAKKVNLQYIINLSNPHHVRSIVKSIFILPACMLVHVHYVVQATSHVCITCDLHTCHTKF